MIDLGDNIVNLWEARLLTDGKKLLKRSYENTFLFLNHHPESADSIAYNEFSCQIVVTKKTAWAQSGRFPRQIGDPEATSICQWLERLKLHGVTKNMVFDSVEAVGQLNPIHPLRDYLWSVKWDQTPRLDNWLTYYLGVEASDYSKAVGSRFMISAAARALRPGCKVDTMLILEGPQGKQKTSAGSVLFGEKYFTEQLSNFSSKDASQEMAGIWCVEIAELDHFQRSENETIKKFLTRRVDRFRPPYKRTVVEVPRGCVFWGTTNGKSYLKDATGGRRFWPIECTAIDLKAIAEDRDQLWAEAVQRLANQERWWFDPSDKVDLNSVQIERYDHDVWTELLLSEAKRRDHLTMMEALTIIGLPAPQQNQSHKNRVSNILTVNGWSRKTERIGGNDPTLVYRPPVADETSTETSTEIFQF